MNYKLEAFCEIDKFAQESYCAIHKTSYLKNLVDVTKVNSYALGEVTMVCGGSPCQDFSVAGKEKGNVYKCGDCGHEWNPLTVHYSKRGVCPKCGCNRIEGTRSSLVCHFLRIVRKTKPKFGLFENVKALVNKKHRDTFELFLKELQEYGYNTYWKVLNAKDFGIPQKRERVIVVFVRKDMDNGKFEFPRPIGCSYPVLALMEEDVPENFYITGEKVEKFLEEYFSKEHRESDKELVQSGYLHNNADTNRVYDSNGVVRTIKAEAGGGGAKTGWYVINKSNGEAKTLKASYGKEGYQSLTNRNPMYSMTGVARVINPERDGTSRTIKSNYGKSSLANFKNKKDRGTTAVCCCAAIRKLSPKECFRLMGFDDADYEDAKAAGVSNTQLYKQCGNSIVVDMLYYVLKALRGAIPELFDDLYLLSLFSGIGAFEKALDKLGGPMEHDWDWEAWERMQDSKSDGFAASMRNGNRHTPSAKSEQRIESEGKREMNTVSTVEKDCMLMEVRKYGVNN